MKMKLIKFHLTEFKNYTSVPFSHKIMLFPYLLQQTNGGIVMVNFFSDYILCKNEGRNATLADVAGKFAIFLLVFFFFFFC